MLRALSATGFLSVRGLGIAMGTGRNWPVSRGDLLCSKLPSLLEALLEWLIETLLLRRSSELSTLRMPAPEALLV